MRTTALIAALTISVTSMAERPEGGAPQPQSPEDSMRQLVEALAARDLPQIEQSFISKAEYARVFPEKAPPFSSSLARFRQAVNRFLAQEYAIEKMQFVRADHQFCKEPMAVPRGYRGFRESCVLYDNIHLIVRIDQETYSFKVDELVAENGRWVLLDGIQLLRLIPVQ